MAKADIARSIHQQARVSEAEAADLLERILELITSTLRQGEPLSSVASASLRFAVKALTKDVIRARVNP